MKFKPNKAFGMILFVFLFTVVFLSGLWYYVTKEENNKREIILSNWNQLQMHIVVEAARATQEWIDLRIEVQGLPKTAVEQEVFKKFIDPIRVLKSGDAFIYNRNYVIFDASQDFPDIYKGKGIRQIYEIQKASSASHMEDLVYGIENATQNTGWYIWLPDKGREFVAWTSVRLKDDTWTIGLSTPEKEIFENSDLYSQHQFIIFSCSIISILLLILAIFISLQIIKSARRMNLLEDAVKQRTSELEQSNLMLKKEIFAVNDLSIHDNLTGLFNRTYFEKEIINIDREENLPISIIMGDINGLKLINDAFGHDEGDILLQRAAKILKDTNNKSDFIARIGGDEFIMVLSNTDESASKDIISAIKKRCKEDIGLNNVIMSISLGYGTKKLIDENMRNIYKMAEDRMYSSKLNESRSLRSSIISSLKKTLEERTHETEQHCERIKVLAKELGNILNLHENSLEEIELLSILHDIGKIAIPDHILQKSGKLDDEEWKIMKKHCEIGFRIANATPDLAGIAEKILCHHERWNGTGYPQGLKNDEIPIESRIISVVDAYDAMTNKRTYNIVRTKDEAVAELKQCAGTQFDPDITKIFIENVLGKEW